MSNRRDLETRIHSLNDIKEIMNAMKNLSLMETHRLARFLDTQHRVAASVESVAADFLQFHAELLPGDEEFRDAYLIVGSERGFCGDFNESLLRAFGEKGAGKPASLVVVGGKLASKFADDPRVTASVPGASVVEEVDGALSKIVEGLNRLRVTGTGADYLRLTVFHHDPDHDKVQISTLRPFKQPKSASTHFAYAPMLNMEPKSFLTGLVEQYLVALLQELLYRSLMAESQRRMQHMDAAVRRLERTARELWQRRNIVRQEEITEEIEVIMLSVESFR
jgi:F-type H+-transporting ATPase subunit gamma